MKITAVEAHVCNARMRNWIFVRVATDEPEIYGWGEATLEWHTDAVVGALKDLESLVAGEDPTRIEHLWQMMFRQHFWHGNGLVRATAISGIDLALWDILGKSLGVPCHRLLGGPVRDYVRLYRHREMIEHESSEDRLSVRAAFPSTGTSAVDAFFESWNPGVNPRSSRRFLKKGPNMRIGRGAWNPNPSIDLSLAIARCSRICPSDQFPVVSDLSRTACSASDTICSNDS